MQTKQFNFLVKQVKDRSFIAIASTEEVDRDDEIILTDAWRNGLDDYRKNPVIMYGHDLKNLPVAKALAVNVIGGELLVNGQFPEKGVSKLSDEVYGLMRGGYLNFLSVGFQGQAQLINGKRTYTEVKLLEISLVPVPANMGARVLSVKNYDPAENIDIESIEYIPSVDIDLESIELDLETRIRYEQQREWSKEFDQIMKKPSV